jgi:hypothetical protein
LSRNINLVAFLDYAIKADVSLDMGVAFAFAEVVFAAAVARSIAHLLERHLVEAAQLAAVQLLASLAQFFKRQNTNL